MIGWTDGTSLYHYGILGMKWGERRYQNLDGTYTEEGLRRKRIGIFGNKPKTIRTIKRTSDKDRRKMTNEELQKRADRLQLEKRVKELERDVNPRPDQWVGDALKKIASKTIVQVGTSAAVALGVAYLKTAKNVDIPVSEVQDHIKYPDPKNQW